MALQDGLLSFQIKETIFLSSDKAGIGDLKELELVPDVEIIENPGEVSITGCLQLHGKYEPVRGTSEDDEGGADTLLAAMKFTPFQFEQKNGSLYGSDLELAHRIPLNITIPSNRVSDIEDIYAIVDSFDYQLEAPNQLIIEAQLKIAGIGLEDQATQSEAAGEPEWEFVHAANEQEEHVVETASLDDIERKLAELEQEIAQKDTDRQERARELPQPYVKPYVLGFEPPAYEQASFPPPSEDSYQPFGDLSSEQQQTEYAEKNEAVFTGGQLSEQSDHMTEVSAQDDEVIPTEQSAVDAPQQAEPATANEELPEEMAVEVMASETPVQEVAETEEPAQPEEPVEEVKEMRVAIGSKPTSSGSGSLNLTSIFSQARRAQEYAAPDAPESASSSSRKPSLQEPDSTTVEAMHNLTSFVRNKEERYSTMKLCIIQRDETLESISTRYSLPVSKILEVNKLTSDRVSEGQILYIPL